MKEQFKYGGLCFVSFILIDIICLFVANAIAPKLYLDLSIRYFTFDDYVLVVVYMVPVDLFVTFLFNTLNNVIRRSISKEIIESIKHVLMCIVVLALILFSTKQGAAFSRLTIYLAHALFLVFIIIGRSIWKEVIKARLADKDISTALLVTTDSFASDGINLVEKDRNVIKGLFITDITKRVAIKEILIISDKRDALAFISWKWIDKVYVFGPGNFEISEDFLGECKQMGLPIIILPTRKSLDYEVVKIRTALSKNDIATGLSFFEGEHDIPFSIRRFYTFFETEELNQMGFHPHKQSWHMFFCPFGDIEVYLDTGKERMTVSLSDPSVGLIIHPSVWREIIWKKSGSVLCVVASGHYEPERLRNDYSEYERFLKEKEWSAEIESAEFTGEIAI